METQRHAFAFQTGSWRVSHRKLRSRLSGSSEWDEFPGTCEARELLGGNGNIEEHHMDDPAGAYSAVGLRALNAKTNEWAIWWLDGRAGEIDVPVRGRFEDGRGIFRASHTLDGRAIDVCFIWSEITPNSACWEQAFALAGTGGWEVNWRMRFERAE